MIQFDFIKDPLFIDGDKEKKDTLRKVMWDNVSIVRTTEGLKEAQGFINDTLKQPIGRLLRLRLLTAKSIVEGALDRSTSIGVHYRTN